MQSAVSPDWLKSKAERKILYQVTKTLIDSSQLTWDELLKSALGRTYTPSPTYLHNFSQGRSHRRHAKLIYAWLREHYLQHAERVEVEIAALHGDVLQHPPWDEFLRGHAEPGDIEIVILPKPSLGIVTFAELEPISEQPVRRGQLFCFRLTSRLEGFALALQWTRGQWYPLPLARDDLISAVSPGVQALPKDAASDAPIPLSEDANIGLHRFAFLVADETICRHIATHLKPGVVVAPATLKGIASHLGGMPRRAWQLYRIGVLFIE